METNAQATVEAARLAAVAQAIGHLAEALPKGGLTPYDLEFLRGHLRLLVGELIAGDIAFEQYKQLLEP